MPASCAHFSEALPGEAVRLLVRGVDAGVDESLFHAGGQVVKSGGRSCAGVVDKGGAEEPWLIKHGLFLSLSTRFTGVLLHTITDLSTWESRISATSWHLVPQIHQPVTTTTI
jgi:hypothetical protein